MSTYYVLFGAEAATCKQLRGSDMAWHGVITRYHLQGPSDED